MRQGKPVPMSVFPQRFRVWSSGKAQLEGQVVPLPELVAACPVFPYRPSASMFGGTCLRVPVATLRRLSGPCLTRTSAFWDTVPAQPAAWPADQNARFPLLLSRGSLSC